MDFWEIVPFLVGLLYFFFRSDKNKEKKPPARQRQAPRQQQEHSPQPNLEDILRELAGQSAPEPKVIEVQEERKHSLVSDQKPVEEYHRPDRGPKKKLVIAKVEMAEQAQTDFDLRQAIIYEAIMNRPDY